MGKGRQLTLPERVDPASTALIVIDVQNDFCHPDGYHARAGADMSMMSAFVAQLEHLVASARKAGVFIVWVRATYDEIVQSEALAEQLAKGGVSPIRCSEGTWGADWFYPLRPANALNEVVVTKHRYSAFWDSPIDLLLRSNGIKTVVTTGVITSGCVESTARDAFFRGYSVVVAGDSCASYSHERHDASLRKFAMTMGTVCASSDVADLWRQAKPGRRGWQLEAKQQLAPRNLTDLIRPDGVALVVIDMQNDFCHADGVMGRAGEDLSHNQSIIPTIAHLADAARAAGVLVIHVQANYGDTIGGPSWLFTVGETGLRQQCCLPNSWGARQVDEIPVRAGEPIVVKHRYSAFADTRLDNLLRSNGIRTLICVGTATQACVESTVREAKLRDYHVVVPPDAVAARGRMRHMHKASLEVMGLYFATLATTADIVQTWGQAPRRAAAE
jgi:ureidoacrylate peracid hydrolase